VFCVLGTRGVLGWRKCRMTILLDQHANCRSLSDMIDLE